MLSEYPDTTLAENTRSGIHARKGFSTTISLSQFSKAPENNFDGLDKKLHFEKSFAHGP